MMDNNNNNMMWTVLKFANSYRSCKKVYPMLEYVCLRLVAMAVNVIAITPSHSEVQNSFFGCSEFSGQ